jgi:hypothetical protein
MIITLAEFEKSVLPENVIPGLTGNPQTVEHQFVCHGWIPALAGMTASIKQPCNCIGYGFMAAVKLTALFRR